MIYDLQSICVIGKCLIASCTTQDSSPSLQTNTRCFTITEQQLKILRMASVIDYVNYNGDSENEDYNTSPNGSNPTTPPIVGPKLKRKSNASKVTRTTERQVSQYDKDMYALPAGATDESDDSEGSTTEHQPDKPMQKLKKKLNITEKNEEKKESMWELSKWCLMILCILVLGMLACGLIYAAHTYFNSNETGLIMILI